LTASPKTVIATKAMRLAIRFLTIGVTLVVAHQVFFCIVLPLGEQSRTAARLMQCRDNLKEIGLALHNYHDVYRSFPPAYVADAEGRPMHSWRALLLPFLDEPERYAKYRFDEPWDSEHNLRLASDLAEARRNPYACPEAELTDETSYVAVTGPNTAWPGATCRRVSEFKDGISNTILVIEVADSGIRWTEPRDLAFDEVPFTVTDPRTGGGRGLSSRHISDIGGCFCDPEVFCGAHVLVGDGSVRRLALETQPELLRAMLTIDGGEDVDHE
jgi:hypothetical protein